MFGFNIIIERGLPFQPNGNLYAHSKFQHMSRIIVEDNFKPSHPLIQCIVDKNFILINLFTDDFLLFMSRTFSLPPVKVGPIIIFYYHVVPLLCSVKEQTNYC